MNPESELEELVRRTSRDVWRFQAHLVDAVVAEDLTQETFLRAWRSWPSFRGDSSARTWLLTIARRVAMDELRRRSRQRATVPLERAPEPAYPDPAGLIVATDLLNALDPDRREAFVLTSVMGLSYAEAAQLCEVPIGTIRSRVARARMHLVALVEQAQRGEPDPVAQPWQQAT